MGHMYDMGSDGNLVKVLMPEMKRGLEIDWEDKMAECCDEELNLFKKRDNSVENES